MLPRAAWSPTDPAFCSAAVASVDVTCHASGWVVPDFHSFARSVVDDVPSTWTFMLNRSPAFHVTPETGATLRVTAPRWVTNHTVPSARSQARTRYCSEPTCRAMTPK